MIINTERLSKAKGEGTKLITAANDIAKATYHVTRDALAHIDPWKFRSIKDIYLEARMLKWARDNNHEARDIDIIKTEMQRDEKAWQQANQGAMIDTTIDRALTPLIPLHMADRRLTLRIENAENKEDNRGFFLQEHPVCELARTAEMIGRVIPAIAVASGYTEPLTGVALSEAITRGADFASKLVRLKHLREQQATHLTV